MSIEENKSQNTTPEERIAEIINGFKLPEELLRETAQEPAPEIEPKPEALSMAAWYEKYEKPDIMDRFKVHMIDSAIVYLIFCAVYYFIIPDIQFNIATFIIMYFFFVYTNVVQFFDWIVLFLTNGYTPGKYICKHRVFRTDGQKLTWKNVIVRSLLIKGFCNAASCGILNIVSIIVAYIKPSSCAIHDIAANTITVDVSVPKTKKEKLVEFK